MGKLTRTDTHAVTINAFEVANDNITPLPFVVANQNQANGTRTAAVGELGSLTIGRLRAHDSVLSAAVIEENHDVEAPLFYSPPVTLKDTEPDGLDDDWEMHFFQDLDEIGSGDNDVDGLDYWERQSHGGGVDIQSGSCGGRDDFFVGAPGRPGWHGSRI